MIVVSVGRRRAVGQVDRHQAGGAGEVHDVAGRRIAAVDEVRWCTATSPARLNVSSPSRPCRPSVRTPGVWIGSVMKLVGAVAETICTVPPLAAVTLKTSLWAVPLISRMSVRIGATVPFAVANRTTPAGSKLREAQRRQQPAGQLVAGDAAAVGRGARRVKHGAAGAGVGRAGVDQGVAAALTVDRNRLDRVERHRRQGVECNRATARQGRKIVDRVGGSRAVDDQCVAGRRIAAVDGDAAVRPVGVVRVVELISSLPARPLMVSVVLLMNSIGS